ncbi:unnamed protein product [Gadus morhua 'NCC']
MRNLSSSHCRPSAPLPAFPSSCVNENGLPRRSPRLPTTTRRPEVPLLLSALSAHAPGNPNRGTRPAPVACSLPPRCLAPERGHLPVCSAAGSHRRVQAARPAACYAAVWQGS